MRTEIVDFEPSVLPALREFAQSTWRRPRSEAYYRWRYADCPLNWGVMAMREGRCHATLFGFRRPYRLGERRVEVREVFDWYTRPELRNSGLGVRLMRHLMRQEDGDPLMLVGGSEDTRTLLPKLGFDVVGPVHRYVLPLGVERAAEQLARRRVPRPLGRALFGAARAAWFAPRRRARPAGGRVIAVSMPGEEIDALYAGTGAYASLPLWPIEHARWLSGLAALGQFLTLYFVVGEALVGWALVRIAPLAGGCDAEIIECFTPTADPGRYTWMVSEIALRVAGFGAGVLALSTRCEALARAARRNRFVAGPSVPLQLWSRGVAAFDSPCLIGANTGDTAILLGDEPFFAPPGSPSPPPPVRV